MIRNRARKKAAEQNRAREKAAQHRKAVRPSSSGEEPLAHGRGSVPGPLADGRGSDRPLSDGRGSVQARDPDAGFDAVIGNPPYLFITEVPADQRRFFESTYDAVSYRFDLYGAFIERAARFWLRAGGRFGFIIPHTLLSNDSFRALRAMLAQEATVYHLVDFGPGVFQTARNETLLLFFTAGSADAHAGVDVIRTTPKLFPGCLVRFKVAHAEWVRPDGAPWLVHVTPDLAKVIRRMQSWDERLGALCTINQGLRTGDNARYLAPAPKGPKWKAAVGGKHVSRYGQLRPELFVYYEPSVLDAPRKEHLFTSGGKIVVQEVRNIALPRRIVAAFDDAQTFCLQSTNVINASPTCPYDLPYLLGVLNSELVNLFFRVQFPGNNHIASNQLAQIPVPRPERSQHDRMVALVQQMLDLHKQLSAAKTPHEKAALQRQIDATDRQIDRLVCELYDLTDDEIRIVEEATG